MHRSRHLRDGQGGFTLIEVVVALGILSFVILTFLGTRTEAMIDATEARNWRLAREIAHQVLSELQAGARESPPDGTRVPLEKYENFSYQILIGEDVISDHESDSMAAFDSSDDNRGDRLAWQRERDDLRRAQQKGQSLQDYRESQRQKDTDIDQDNEVPSEDELEEVLVVVYFPEVRITDEGRGETSFKLRAKVSTLAIEGLTPEDATQMARARGLETETPGGAGATGGTEANR